VISFCGISGENKHFAALLFSPLRLKVYKMRNIDYCKNQECPAIFDEVPQPVIWAVCGPLV
jgi:hypothetical protein